MNKPQKKERGTKLQKLWHKNKEQRQSVFNECMTWNGSLIASVPYENSWLRMPKQYKFVCFFFFPLIQQAVWISTVTGIDPANQWNQHIQDSLASMMFSQSELRGRVKHHILPITHLSQKGTQGWVSPAGTLLLGKDCFLRTPSSLPSYLVGHSCITCAPYSRDCIHIFEIRGSLPIT